MQITLRVDCDKCAGHSLADKDDRRYGSELDRHFHRRNLRAHLLMGLPGPKKTGRSPTQRFDGKSPVNAAVFA